MAQRTAFGKIYGEETNHFALNVPTFLELWEWEPLLFHLLLIILLFWFGTLVLIKKITNLKIEELELLSSSLTFVC